MRLVQALKLSTLALLSCAAISDANADVIIPGGGNSGAVVVTSGRNTDRDRDNAIDDRNDDSGRRGNINVIGNNGNGYDNGTYGNGGYNNGGYNNGGYYGNGYGDSRYDDNGYLGTGYATGRLIQQGRGDRTVIYNGISSNNGGDAFAIQNGQFNRFEDGDHDLGNGQRISVDQGRVNGTLGNAEFQNRR